jgi:hypothetical protein
MIGLLRAPALKLARVLHSFVRDGEGYRLRTFHVSLTSLADEVLFEAQRRSNFADRPEEAIHKSLELQRRYALDPDVATEKYFRWLDETGREDPNWPPDIREAWRKIRQRLREEDEGALH